ncbi:MAG: restriction endonuclease [Clostridia bacterium]|nr:restriction endonuclease [Clostridia bacterium]
MSNIIELTDVELKESIEKLYNSFDNGYEFEEFLKYFLEKIGLEEVAVTQRSRDGGIDLTCVKSGINGLSNLDEVKYYIQAKCYKPSSTISIKDLRELRGVMPLNYKGIFITTAKFPSGAKEFAEEDKSRQIILIDGKSLVQQCISIGLGFNLKPVFDAKTLESLTLHKEIKEEVKKESVSYDLVIRKQISLNDIRARILRMPSEIEKEIPKDITNLKLNINGKDYELNINAERTYLGGVTKLFKDEGLILENNLFKPKMAIWNYSKDKILVEIKGENN